MNLQHVIDAMNDASRHERSRYHLTLGELLDVLEPTDGHKAVEFSDGTLPDQPRSYRGYYSDLALSATGDDVTVSTLENQLKAVHDTELKGYKGGDFLMDDDIPLWKAEWGVSGGRPILGTEWKGNTLVLVLGD